MRTYSSIVVIDSLLKSDEIDSTIDKIERNIKNNGGEIMEVDRWGKKRLAYEIKKRQYGYYVEFYFKAGASVIKVIEREYGLDENILRYLTIVLDKKALEYRQQEKEKSLRKKTEESEEKNEQAKKDESPSGTEKSTVREKSKETVE
ncbi:30S ribosomal protein S6 [candidate division KSB1 bacterium]|nr:30S ribosomal protein S6 [candidate division KSB1 bacterium]